MLTLASNLGAARSQMAFTLGFHIILASLGVALPAMMLIANYLGLKRGDADALKLARRWSKAVAVTFAVGAVTGTVLSFEFGLLWPAFTGRFGQVFGVLFAIEGLFFFLEAIFIAIYIFGWRYLSPWAHFWSGVPVVISGLGGAFSVVAVNSWMNQPQGFSPTTGKVTSVEPWKVIFNPAVPYEVPHMILAAYLVTGFLVASIYAVGMLRGRRDRIHRLGLLIPLTVASIVTPIQFAVGDTAARAIAKDQPVKFAAMECVQQTHSDVTEYIYGRCTADGVKGGLGIPGFDSFLVGWSTSTEVTGLDSVAPDDRPPYNTMLHWAFDTMVGICTVLIALGAWFGFAWWRRRDIPKTKWFLRAVALSGVSAIVALECGWIITEVGRQPWIVYNVMRTSDAVTHADGIWVTFSLVLALYIALGATLIITLRAMSRRWRDEDGDDEVPYGPDTGPPPLATRSAAMTARERRRRHPRRRRNDVRGLRRRRLRGGVLEPARRWRGARPAAARADRLGNRAGVGGEPRLADLRARRPLDRLPVRLRVHLLDAVHPAEPGCVRDRPARSRLRVPAHRAPRTRPSPFDDRVRRVVGADPVLPWARSSARSRAAACRSAMRQATG